MCQGTNRDNNNNNNHKYVHKQTSDIEMNRKKTE